MPTRTAEATWKGDLQQGTGSLELGSGAYQGAYSFSSRFESGTGTNPEELIGAALAGCFSMQLAANLSRAGFTVDHVHTTANVHLTKGDSGFSISRIDLDSETSVQGADQTAFNGHVEKAKGCIIARALAGVPEIAVNARMV